MTVIAGLPAHVLLVHFLVVLAPLTALLTILCGLWPAARRRLVWLVLALVLTPLTTSAGEWLYNREQQPSEMLHTHEERGESMIYFSVALLVAAVAVAVLHWWEGRSGKYRLVANVVVAIVAVAVGVSSTVAVVRIGDSGARAVWGDELSQAGED